MVIPTYKTKGYRVREVREPNCEPKFYPETKHYYFLFFYSWVGFTDLSNSISFLGKDLWFSSLENAWSWIDKRIASEKELVTQVLVHTERRRPVPPRPEPPVGTPPKRP